MRPRKDATWGIGPSSNSVQPGPGSHRGCVMWVRCRPSRQRRLCYILVRARCTRRHTYTHFLSLARLTHLTDSIVRVSDRLVHLGRFIWTRVPNLPSQRNPNFFLTLAKIVSLVQSYKRREKETHELSERSNRSIKRHYKAQFAKCARGHL
jgi:hypothetical protein